MDINAKPDYQQWSEEDFASDVDVQAMPCISRYIYRTLLQKGFVYKTRPDLPADERMLWKLAQCEDIEMWNKYKGPVLEKFEKDFVDGVEVLYQKRLREDWQKLVDKRLEMSNAGKTASAARWNKEPIEKPKVTQKELDPFDYIPKECFKIFNIGAGNEHWYKNSLKGLIKNYGRGKVCEAFDIWASHQTSISKDPIQKFCKDAPSYIDNAVVKENSELDDLCVSLYKIGNKTVEGKYRNLLNTLLTEFSLQEVERAYKKFIKDKDDFDMKMAVKNFSEGGGRTIILANREAELKERQIEESMVVLTEQARLKVEQELEAAREIIEEEL